MLINFISYCNAKKNIHLFLYTGSQCQYLNFMYTKTYQFLFVKIEVFWHKTHHWPFVKMEVSPLHVHVYTDIMYKSVWLLNIIVYTNMMYMKTKMQHGVCLLWNYNVLQFIYLRIKSQYNISKTSQVYNTLHNRKTNIHNQISFFITNNLVLIFHKFKQHL